MNIFDTIKHFKLNQMNEPTIIMLRHAEKEPLYNGLKDSNRSITESGRRKSTHLGKTLNYFNIKTEFIKTSPLLRCVETGRAILNEKAVKLIHSNYLGDPGAYVKKSRLAEEGFNRYSVEEVIEKILKDHPLPGFYNKRLGTSFLLKELREDLEHLSHFAFYITHDTILAPFVGTCSNQLITKENWFNFLDGICIKKHGDEEIAIYWGTQQFITQGSSK